MLRIAVTGSIACGKSRVAQYLETCGIPVCEADRVAHKVLAPRGAAFDDVVAVFGQRVLTETGEIDRVELGKIVFSDPVRMAALNQVVHPVVRAEIDHWLGTQAALLRPMVVVVVPLLFEARMEQGWDAVVCVACSPEVQRRRLRSRGLDEEDCTRRIAAQMGQAMKMARSDYVIWNDAGESALEQQIDDVLKSIQERA